MKQATLDDCRVLNLDTVNHQRRGNLTVCENGRNMPFDVKRVYYLYDVPGGESRGGHSHRELHEMIVAVSGSFTVTLDDGKEKRSYMLNRSNKGLHIVPGIWRTLDDFSSGAVCLVLASDKYIEADYIRLYEDFLDSKSEN
ncbi:MAG: FdtA/QdtA family cupin domain-containing protein [Bacteroides sp.]|nr:FdtA/QdtA family cupin domain-containing protein [Lachnospiraceae bacterium]MCM1333184.1 FdtA/QdtA family cupin domain-containing protein [Bacteroides sp.]MCM1390097.1 FdtA/QdtA family cupin domain-containing protein [Bacteroides sp.]